MKALIRFIKRLILTILLLIAILYIFNYDYMLKAVRTIYMQGHSTAFLNDFKEFDNDTIEAGTPQPWPLHAQYNSVEPTAGLMEWHDKLGTVAFLIIKNDSIWYEKYYDGYDESSRSNSFSVAKSMVTSMLGKAIMEGKVKGLQQPLSDFFPQFSEGYNADVTVGDLASMASGLDWDEAYYSPFSITTRAYFYDDLREMMLDLDFKEEPGKDYKYLSGNTQLLGMVLEKATDKSLSDYLSDSFWKPMGAEHSAYWQLDDEENGIEKAYCCVATNARDFARFGKLYKDFGMWNGRKILDSAFVVRSITPRFKESPQYGYGWWLPEHNGKQFFMMRGHLGQYIIVQPEDNLIIVRLGHKNAKGPDPTIKFSDDIYAYIDEAYKMLSP
ncbi:MAG: beta-lactamase family protein [Bacteroidia bacterium]|nr:beta-lactamase family protein [Bacteroidia bacterium]